MSFSIIPLIDNSYLIASNISAIQKYAEKWTDEILNIFITKIIFIVIYYIFLNNIYY